MLKLLKATTSVMLNVTVEQYKVIDDKLRVILYTFMEAITIKCLLFIVINVLFI